MVADVVAVFAASPNDAVLAGWTLHCYEEDSLRGVVVAEAVVVEGPAVAGVRKAAFEVAEAEWPNVRLSLPF